MDQSTIPFLHKTDHDDEDARLPLSVPSKITKLRAFANIPLYTLAVWGTISLLIQTQSLIFPPMDVYRPFTLLQDDELCAYDPSSKDCVYDSLAAAFLPPYCRDDALTAKFESSFAPPSPLRYLLPTTRGTAMTIMAPQGMSWPYYLDANRTEAIGVEDIASMGANGIFWATRE